MDQIFAYYRAIQSIRYQSLKKYLESHSYTKDEMKEILDPVLETMEFIKESDKAQKESVPHLDVMKAEFWNVFYELCGMEQVFKFVIDFQKDPNTKLILPICVKSDEYNDRMKSYLQ